VAQRTDCAFTFLISLRILFSFPAWRYSPAGGCKGNHHRWKKHALAAIALLGGMMGKARDDKSGKAGHGVGLVAGWKGDNFMHRH
jgi:hypothetical protein